MKTKYKSLLCAIALSAFASAQIPNGSFETWTSTDPDSWETNNTNSSSNIISVTKVSQSKAGTNGMKMAAWSYSGFVFGPIAICPASGNYFAYSGQPTMITFWVISNLQGGDKLTASGVLRKGNASIAGGSLTFTNTTSVFQQVQIPFTYSNHQNSDSATMFITIFDSNGGGTALNPGSYIIVDDVQFSNASPLGIAQRSLDESLSVTQNASEQSMRLEYSIKTSGHVVAQIFDIQGKSVRKLYEGSQQTGTYRIDENTSGLSDGIYVLRFESPDGVAVRKILMTEK